jgi:hypothetical protein
MTSAENGQKRPVYGNTTRIKWWKGWLILGRQAIQTQKRTMFSPRKLRQVVRTMFSI